MLMKPINLAIMLGLAGAGGYLAYDKIKSSNAAEEPVVYETKDYEVAAPGRIEPKSGEIRLGATYLGRVEEVLVKVDDKVEEGELLLRLDDDGRECKTRRHDWKMKCFHVVLLVEWVAGREQLRTVEWRALFLPRLHSCSPAQQAITIARQCLTISGQGA